MRSMKEQGISNVILLGDQAFGYEYIPKMWRILPGFKNILVNVPREVEKKYFEIDKSIIGPSRFQIMNVIALKEALEQNYDPVDDLNKSWSNEIK
jgi:hypothetical protein